MPAARRFPLLLIGAFLALYLVWGSTYLFIRIGVESWPPMLMAGVRFLIAGGLLYGFLRWRGVPAPTWPQWRAAGAIGFLLLSCGNGGVTVAEHAGVASGVAALAVATVPLFTLLFGLLFGHRNSKLEWAGIALGLVGIGLLNLGSNLQASPIGAALIIFAAASWAFGSVWSKTLPLPQGPMASAAEMLVGGAVLLLGSVVSGERMTQMPTAAGWGRWPTWCSSARSWRSVPTCTCSSMCARLPPPAMPTSTRQWRCCWALSLPVNRLVPKSAWPWQ